MIFGLRKEWLAATMFAGRLVVANLGFTADCTIALLVFRIPLCLSQDHVSSVSFRRIDTETSLLAAIIRLMLLQKLTTPFADDNIR
jgi:hypothetical protein